MALEILYTKADNTHENEQFRRIANDLKVLFDKKKWDGLLIGNPFTYGFSRFRADALIYYTNGLIVIDLKDYSGEIHLPANFNDLKGSKWYIENTTDKRRTEVKGGSYKNPFAQLNTYRGTLKELIKSNLILSESINGDRMCIANIFRPPIKLVGDGPRDVPYYRITDEATFQTLLCDFASSDKFSKDAATEFKRIFPSEPWIDRFELNIAPKENIPFLELIDDNFKTIISDFIKHPEQQILLLESGDTRKRDEWMQYILSQASDNVPQTEVWAHSTRIARRIKKRTGIEPQSLFCTVYGGNVDNSSDVESAEDETEEISEAASEKIP
ncbi:MAG TPA: nuclease-related domain-containing protein, partial [Prolixibacteraceae bacterium]